jgi:hypothetical protein
MKTKTKTKLFLSMLTIAIGFTACTKDSPDPVETVITETITELDATAETFVSTQFGPLITGEFTKFSFSEGGVVEGDNWDVAFRSSKIIVNGGSDADTSQPNRNGEAAAYIIDGEMSEITSVDIELLMQDGSNQSMYGTTAIIDDFGQDDLGWSHYNDANPQAPVLEALAGKILVFRTHDGSHYAKVEILNFYDATFTNPYGGFYTFNYVYQSEAEVTTF